MSHQEFIRAYENGSVGCSASSWLTLRLFIAGKIREKKVSLNLYLWLLSLPVVVIASISGFRYLPVLWALLAMIVGLIIYACAFLYGNSGVVLSVALTNEEFFEFARANRLLWIYTDDEDNLPKTALTPRSRHRRRRY